MPDVKVVSGGIVKSAVDGAGSSKFNLYCVLDDCSCEPCLGGSHLPD